MSKIASASGYDVRRRPRPAVIENAFHTRHREDMLISYVVWPRNERSGAPAIAATHTNQWESLEIARLFGESGFNVDVMNWDDRWFVPHKQYSVVFDIHGNLERLSPLLLGSPSKVLHITGAHWLYQNRAEYTRLLAVQERKGVTLVPRRLAAASLGIELADFVSMLGNRFTKSTFEFARKEIHQVPISTSVHFPWWNRDLGKVRRNFLWFGGPGMVHKGLDLVLEVFAQLPGRHLTVCGPVQGEPDFERAYYRELYQTPNIHTVGWVDVTSEAFGSIVRNNVAMIHPSCSEGQAGSVVTCMHAGLVPIVSCQSGVDVEGFGFELGACSIDEINARVEEVSELPVAELERRARGAWEYARSIHTRERFSIEYRKFVQKVVDGRSARPASS